jgi:hypothetical protein
LQKRLVPDVATLEGMSPQGQTAFTLFKSFLLDYPPHVWGQTFEPVVIIRFSDLALRLLLVPVTGVAQPK